MLGGTLYLALMHCMTYYTNAWAYTVPALTLSASGFFPGLAHQYVLGGQISRSNNTAHLHQCVLQEAIAPGCPLGKLPFAEKRKLFFIFTGGNNSGLLP